MGKWSGGILERWEGRWQMADGKAAGDVAQVSCAAMRGGPVHCRIPALQDSNTPFPDPHFHVSTPFCQAQTRPSTSNKRKIIMAIKAPRPNPVNATAKGRRKMVSTSKM